MTARLAVLVLLLTGGFAAAQTTHTFSGQQRTRARYLFQTTDLSHTPADRAALWAVRQQLVNLPALADARFKIIHQDKDTTVRWTLEESRTRFPLLDFGGLSDNLNVLIGYKDVNWRGLGHELTAYYQNNDGRHNFLLAFRNPGPGGSRWGYGAELRRYASVEPLYFPQGGVNYDYTNLSFGGQVDYRLGYLHRVGVGLALFRENYGKLPGQESLPGPQGLRENKALLKLFHDIDRRDFLPARIGGFQHTTNVQSVLTRGRAGAFFSLWHDWRYFRLVGNSGNFAARLRAGVATNDAGPFAPFVLDSQVNIRGSGNRVDRGTAQLVLNLEYRHIFYRNERRRFALQAVAFSDAGTWRNPGGQVGDLVAEENFRHFVGGGLRYVSTKTASVVLRLDYGVEVRGQQGRGITFGFGHYF